MKTKLTILSLLFSSVLMAQVTNLPTVLNMNEGVKSNHLFGVVPASLSYDGTNRVYIRTATDQVGIYTNNFTPVKQINITPTYDGGQSRHATREVNVTISYGNVTRTEISPDNSPNNIYYYDETSGEYIDTYEIPSAWTNMDIAQYLQQANNNRAVTRIEDVNEGTLFILDGDLTLPDGEYNTSYYYLPATFGKQCPRRAYIVRNGYLYGCWLYYEAERNASYSYGEWIESGETRTYEELVNYGLGFINYDTDQLMFDDENGDGLCLTQTLFNEDAQYEYLYFPISGYKRSNYNYPSDPYEYSDKEESYSYTQEADLYHYSVFAGFEIKSESGATLQSITFPNGFYMSDLSADIIKLSNEYYIICTGMMNENPAMLVYKINRATQSVQQIGAPVRMSAYPNPVNRNNTVTILLSGENAGQTQTELQVTNLQGQVVDRHLVPAGQKQTTIPANNFAPGMNIIRVQQNGQTVGTAKIVAK